MSSNISDILKTLKVLLDPSQVHPTWTYQIPPLSRYGTLEFGVRRSVMVVDLRKICAAFTVPVVNLITAFYAVSPGKRLAIITMVCLHLASETT